MKKPTELFFIGSREFIRQPHFEGLDITVRSLDADPSIDGIALGDSEADDVSLYITRDPKWSSLFQPSVNFDSWLGFSKSYGDQSIVATQRCSVRRADNLFKESLDRPYFVSINAQGSSLPILRGFGKSLRNCMLIQVEVEFKEQYSGASRFGDVYNHLENHGFEIIDLNICRTFRQINSNKFTKRIASRGEINWGDAIFLNTTILPMLAQSELHSLITVLGRMGYVSLALSLSERYFPSNLQKYYALFTSAHSAKMWIRYIPKFIRRSLYSFLAQYLHMDVILAFPKYHLFKDFNRFDRNL